MTRTTVLWFYILFLVVGGWIGFQRAKSRISLNLAIVFGVALSLCAIGLLPRWIADILQVMLLVVFAWRYMKTQKMMPSGMMFLVTLFALALRHLL